MSTTYSSVGGTAVKRIRVPHPNDVLSGRGGGINSHVGNVRFREWVAVRKNDYTLAPSKADKARVAKEVIDLVEHQTPPGRFLQKDPTAVGGAGWWVEIDEERVMAKTSQALREGAPQIRALHRDELDERKSNYDRRRKADAKPESSGKNNKRSLEEMRSAASSPATTTPVSNSISRMHEQAVNELRANAEAAREAKQVRLEYGGNVVLPSEETPPLTSTKIEDNDAMVLPPPLDLDCVPAPHKNMKRTHSLALSDLGNTDDWCATDFVNPFEDEYEAQEFSWTPPSPRPGILRESSTSNNSDMGGIGALMRSDSSRSNTSSSNHNTSNNGVRPKNTVANMSNRYGKDSKHKDEITPLDEWWDVDSYVPVSP